VEVDADSASATVPTGFSLQGDAGDVRRLGTGVLGHELRDVDRLLADHDVLRHYHSREAAVLDRVEHARHRPLAADVEVRPVVELRRADVLRRSMRSRVGKRVAATAPLVEQHRTLVERGVRRRDVDLFSPARGREDHDREQRTPEEGLGGSAHPGPDHTEGGAHKEEPRGP